MIAQKGAENSIKMAPIIQYSSDAVKYYLAVAANSGKLSLVLTNLGGCAIIYEDLRRFLTIGANKS
jgi:hypothetical protein